MRQSSLITWAIEKGRGIATYFQDGGGWGRLKILTCLHCRWGRFLWWHRQPRKEGVSRITFRRGKWLGLTNRPVSTEGEAASFDYVGSQGGNRGRHLSSRKGIGQTWHALSTCRGVPDDVASFDYLGSGGGKGVYNLSSRGSGVRLDIGKWDECKYNYLPKCWKVMFSNPRFIEIFFSSSEVRASA